MLHTRCGSSDNARLVQKVIGPPAAAPFGAQEPRFATSLNTAGDVLDLDAWRGDSLGTAARVTRPGAANFAVNAPRPAAPETGPQTLRRPPQKTQLCTVDEAYANFPSPQADGDHDDALVAAHGLCSSPAPEPRSQLYLWNLHSDMSSCSEPGPEDCQQPSAASPALHEAGADQAEDCGSAAAPPLAAAEGHAAGIASHGASTHATQHNVQDECGTYPGRCAAPQATPVAAHSSKGDAQLAALRRQLERRRHERVALQPHGAAAQHTMGWGARTADRFTSGVSQTADCSRSIETADDAGQPQPHLGPASQHTAFCHAAPTAAERERRDVLQQQRMRDKLACGMVLRLAQLFSVGKQ